jgi:hypothetical protein
MPGSASSLRRDASLRERSRVVFTTEFRERHPVQLNHLLTMRQQSSRVKLDRRTSEVNCLGVANLHSTKVETQAGLNPLIV